MTTSIRSFPQKSDLEKCNIFISEHLKDKAKFSNNTHGDPITGPAITLTQKTGIETEDLSASLAKRLDMLHSSDGVSWMVFDHQLIDRVLSEHGLPLSLKKLIPLKHRSYYRDVIEEFVGLRPPSWEMGAKIAETVLHLASAGRVILVGRGTDIVTKSLQNTLHIHLTASLDWRAERLAEKSDRSIEEARSYAQKSDHENERFIQQYFGKRTDDLRKTHLVLRVDLLGMELVEHLIFQTATQTLDGLYDPQESAEDDADEILANPILLPERLLQ